MTPEQTAFIARRRRQIRAWPWMAAVLLLLLAGAYAWLWRVAPHNLSPWLILDDYARRQLADQELIHLAARGSVALIACGLAALALVGMVSVSLWNEHRLIRLLDELGGGAAPGGADSPETGGVPPSGPEEGAAQDEDRSAAPDRP